MGLFSRWAINLLFFSAVAVYLAGLAIDIMEIDAAQYASLSREMAETGSYLEVYHRGNDYLDKPPLLFWVSSFFIKLFGTSNFAYKIGSVLFSILGIVSTYKLGHLLYNKRIGFVAAIMLGTSQAYFLFNHDVRTDTILTNTVIFAVWQIMAYVFYHNKWHLIGGFVGIGLGMLAKGPIALMVPVLALGSYFIGRKRYKEFFRVEWLIGIGIVAVMLAPMAYGLYTQFDQQPEKEILFMSDAGNRTETEVSGLRFYFWTQSFGRITGENVWKDNSPPTFFIDTFLWSFLPWAILGVWAILWRIFNTTVDVIKRRKKQEWLTLGGFVIPFIAFSMSSYKLPHYIFVLFPFAAIITAEFVLRVLYEKPKWWTNIMTAAQVLIVAGLIAVPILIMTHVFEGAPWYVWAGFIALMLSAIASFFSKEGINKVVLSSALAIIAANWVLNMHFYPRLMEYQPSRKVAQLIEEQNLPKDQIFVSASYGFHMLEYYADHTFYNAYSPQFMDALIQNGEAWVYLNKQALDALMYHYEHVEIIEQYDAFHVTMLSWEFLNPDTRDETFKTQYFVKVVL